MLRRSSRSIPSEPNGALATIADGFSLVLARPWLMIFPVVVDLLLWLGVQVSIKPFTTPFARLMRESGGANGDEASRQILALGESVRLNDLLALFLPSVFAGLPRDNAFNWLVSALFPPLTSGIDRRAMYRNWGSGLFGAWFPPQWVAVLTLAMVFVLAATLLAIAFRVPIARAVRHSNGLPTATSGVREAPMAWLRLIGLLGLGILVVCAVIIPFVLIALLMLIFGAGLAFLIAFGCFGLGAMGAIYVYFALDIAMLDGVGPITAIRSSFWMVRGRFGECARFALACIVIQTGLLRVWHVLAESPPGIALALLTNAFVGAGIVAATMLFIARRPDRAIPPPRPIRH
jgi:hypothetical protein